MESTVHWWHPPLVHLLHKHIPAALNYAVIAWSSVSDREGSHRCSPPISAFPRKTWCQQTSAWTASSNIRVDSELTTLDKNLLVGNEITNCASQFLTPNSIEEDTGSNDLPQATWIRSCYVDTTLPPPTTRELGVSWDVELYGELLKIGGGKERMTAYFNKTGWPAKAPKTDEERKEFIASLHKRKTELFMALIEKKLLPLRPGVQRLIDEALGKGVKVAVCSTSNEKAVSAIVSCLLGPDRAEKITIFAGDVVPRKKPDPAIYLLAATTLGVDPSSCVVVEDSAIGLSAAKAAGMKCIVTKSGYTAEEDFATADAVFDCIGDPPEVLFDLDFCANLLQKQFVS